MSARALRERVDPFAALLGSRRGAGRPHDAGLQVIAQFARYRVQYPHVSGAYAVIDRQRGALLSTHASGADAADRAAELNEAQALRSPGTPRSGANCTVLAGDCALAGAGSDLEAALSDALGSWQGALPGPLRGLSVPDAIACCLRHAEHR